MFSSRRWLAKIEGEDGVSITDNYKYNQKLFRKYTRNATMSCLTECLFADVVLFCHQQGLVLRLQCALTSKLVRALV